MSKTRARGQEGPDGKKASRAQARIGGVRTLSCAHCAPALVKGHYGGGGVI